MSGIETGIEEQGKSSESSSSTSLISSHSILFFLANYVCKSIVMLSTHTARVQLVEQVSRKLLNIVDKRNRREREDSL